VIPLSRSLALERAPADIRVNAMLPGFLSTQLAISASFPGSLRDLSLGARTRNPAPET
jgi:NAD(P)-dependent dehydrogenase (short-subunit alcohol dehydrogenase family)